MTRRSRPRRSLGVRAVLALAMGLGTALAVSAPAHADLPGASAQLTRAPYLSDSTTASVQVNWGTSTQSKGTVRYGPIGNCAANSMTSGTLGYPMTVNALREYRNSVTLTGLTPGTAYCYRVYTGGSSPVDLLGTLTTPSFTSLAPAGGTAPFSFAVFGDWGDTTSNGVNDGSVNTDQANVLARIGESGVRFALSAGDLAYPGGSQSNYGDLNQTGADISAVYGPQYWALPGMSTPLFAVSGNHGQNSTFLLNWPNAAAAAASGGTYAMVDYPSVDGTDPGSYPTTYYAIATGGVRIYMLDAAWGNSNIGTATGGDCGSHCQIYQVDHDQHWTVSSAQYQWLAQDLAAHPGGVKMAVFHFPLRSDDATEPDNTYLNVSAGPTSLESLLHDNGVNLVFNGHAHDYQRNTAPAGGVVSYVTGGGGGKATPVGGGDGCAATDAYAVGWSYSKNKGSACGSAPVPTDDAQVYHFLKVSVSGTTVTVTPTDSLGRTFDVKTYSLTP
jgi:hypothetical protein